MKVLLELILERFRSFVEPQRIAVRPLTLLVGENGSGKTSFLAALATVGDPGGFPFRPRFNQPPTRSPRVKMVYGGTRLVMEYASNQEVLRVLAELDRAGGTRRVADHEVDAEAARLESEGLCRSNDHHVIALARTAGVRLVCTGDQTLCEDVTDRMLLDGPRGHVYRSRKHRPLLVRFCREP